MTTTRIETVIEPAQSLALVDLATAKDELGIAADNTAQDARLNRYIAQASSLIHGYCRRVFPVQTYRNAFLRRWRPWAQIDPLVLSASPVTDILGISEEGTLLDPVDYEPDFRNGMIWRAAPGLLRCGWYGQEVIVDFKAGFATIPDGVQAAALRLIVMQQSIRGRDPFLKVREGPTYGREEFWVGNLPMLDAGLPQDVAQSLADYVIPSYA
jgi:hypothetical protein